MHILFWCHLKMQVFLRHGENVFILGYAEVFRESDRYRVPDREADIEKGGGRQIDR